MNDEFLKDNKYPKEMKDVIQEQFDQMAGKYVSVLIPKHQLPMFINSKGSAISLADCLKGMWFRENVDGNLEMKWEE